MSCLLSEWNPHFESNLLWNGLSVMFYFQSMIFHLHLTRLLQFALRFCFILISGFVWKVSASTQSSSTATISPNSTRPSKRSVYIIAIINWISKIIYWMLGDGFRKVRGHVKTVTTVCFTDLDHGSEILSRFSLPKSMKHSVD